MGAMVYLAEEGQPSGPHDLDLIEGRAMCNDLDPDCLAFVEGMKTWRSLKEALVWAHGKSLVNNRDDFRGQVELLAAGAASIAQARGRMADVLRATGRTELYSVMQAVTILLAVNSSLLRNCNQFADENAPESAEFHPCWELYRLSDEGLHRNWEMDWRNEGGEFHDGRMIARKDSDVWLALSDFGYPFPPFGMDDSYWTRPVDRLECEEIGLLERGAWVNVPVLEKAFDLVGIPVE